MIRALIMIALGVGAPATAATVKVNFSGTFTGEFSSPLMPIGTAFHGALQYNSADAETAIEPFAKRFVLAGPSSLEIGGTSYSTSFRAFASKSPFGDESIGFVTDLGAGVHFTLNFDFLTEGSIINLRLPADPTVFDRYANAGISTPMMQGNFGRAAAIGSLVAPSVPEPTTWAMMIGGFALAGASMRKRAKVAIWMNDFRSA